MPARMHTVLVPLALVAAALAVYWPGLSGGFLFDDFPNLVLAPDWKIQSLQWDQVQRALRSGVASPAGRPLALLSFGINHALTGMDPFWLKLTGLLFHILNGLLALVLCRGLFDQLAIDPPAKGRAALTATAVAAAWLLHPLQVSSVLYIVQRMELVGATCTLLSLIAYQRARTCQLAGGQGFAWLLASFLALVTGLGFKESAVLTPGYAFLLELFAFQFRRRDGSTSRGWVAAYALAFAGAAVVYGAYVIPLAAPDSLYTIRDFNAGERVLTQMPVLAMYLQQILLPLPDTMRFFYDDFPVSRGLFDPPTTALAGALLLTVGMMGWTARRRWPLTALGIGWFFVGHALTSNIVPLELAFEHRNYLPLLGVLLALVQPLQAASASMSSPVRRLLALLPTAGLATLCLLQAATWGEPLRLGTALQQRAPNSARASYDLGQYYLILSGDDPTAPAWSQARALFEQGAAHGSPLALQGLLMLHGRAGTPVDPRVWRAFREALTRRPLGPESLSALHALSNCRISGICAFDPSPLLQTFLAVMERNPTNGAVHLLYANFLWNVVQDRALAVRMQREAVRLAPADPLYRVALAKFLMAIGTPDSVQEAAGIEVGLRLENTDGALDSKFRELEALRRLRTGEPNLPLGGASAEK